MRTLKLFLAGEWVDGADVIEVPSPFDGATVARVARGGPAELARAADAAAHGAAAMAALSPAQRADILEGVVAEMSNRFDELVAAVSSEAGKPVTIAEVEVNRCLDTITESAHVARHPEVEAHDLRGYASALDRLALVRRIPIGPVLAITPFNFPLNLVAHKLAPAVAAGCPVVLKPASQTPSPALLLAELLANAGLPPGGLSVVPSKASEAQVLAEDRRFHAVTFTGSMDVGWRLKQLAWHARRVTLEMGGNAAVVIEPDAGDIEAIARAVAAAAYGYAGQSCISVQRVLVHADIAEAFTTELIAATRAVVAGDPADRSTVCGPLIDAANADRVEQWIAQAQAAGGACLTGGTRNGNVIEPTLLADVPDDQPVVADEVFGPVAVLSTYADFDEALAMVNDSRYGLQAGLFTNDAAKIQRAWERLEVGGIVSHGVPSWRTDPMPYGGAKDSGIGREGPLYAYREMTEERLLVTRM